MRVDTNEEVDVIYDGQVIAQVPEQLRNIVRETLAMKNQQYAYLTASVVEADTDAHKLDLKIRLGNLETVNAPVE